MKKFSVAALAAALMASTSGCANLSFYPDASMKKDKVGLKTYYSKPYFLVARDGTAKVTGVSLVFLPDLENPVYARARSGYGSANLTVALNNGMITSFGQQTDTKFPESLTALAGLETALATADKLRAEASALVPQSGGLGEHAVTLRAVAGDLERIVAAHQGGALSSNQVLVLINSASGLKALSTAFEAPGASARIGDLQVELSKIIKTLGASVAGVEDSSEERNVINGKVAQALSELNAVSSDFKIESAPPPEMSLYEVVMDDGRTTLREVALGEFVP